MSTTRTGHDFDTQALATTGARTILRAKTVATRLSTDELEEVESAAKRSGKSLAEWLRDTALVAARQQPYGAFISDLKGNQQQMSTMTAEALAAATP